MQTSSINQDGTSKTGQWVVGIRELDKSEHDLYTSDNPPGVPEPFTGRPTSNYTLRTWMCSCSYLDKNTAWSTEGLKVDSVHRYMFLLTWIDESTGKLNCVEINIIHINYNHYKRQSEFNRGISFISVWPKFNNPEV